MKSIGGSDFLFGSTFSGSDPSSYFSDSCHSVLSFLDLDNGDLWWVDWDLIRGTVGFIFSELVNMNYPFLSKYLDDFSLVSLVGTSQDDDLIVFSDWEWSEAVFFPQIFGKGCWHDGISNVWWSWEVGFSAFPSWAGDLGVGLHFVVIYKKIFIINCFITENNLTPSSITFYSLKRNLFLSI